MKTPASLSFARIFGLCSLFSLLAFYGACPSWFLGLLIAIGLMRFSGWLFLKIHGDREHAAPTPNVLSRWSMKAQLVWSALLGAHLAVFGPANGMLIDFGYFILACLQLAALYLTFCRFRPYLLEEFTLRNALS